MQFSEHWLRSLVNPALDSAALGHLLTMAGLEVEDAEPVAPAFSGVVVAQILEAQTHPNADRLRVCRVDVGAGESLQIVCGAPNAAAGMKVPCALVGAVLPGGFEIKAAKLRGVESFGMLCSAKELGISDESAGLLALPADFVVGSSLRDALLLDDTLFTIKLTPNRPDCLSLNGVAREVAALTGTPFAPQTVAPVPAVHAESRRVELDAVDGCPRYFGRILRNLDPTRAAPDWMKQRLERCGVRSISAIVDVTNYVMLELGQPLHAFDNDRLKGAVRVRWASPGDKLVLLNGQELEPDSRTLLIADDAGPLALAGVMGGEASGVTDSTRSVFLESAFFQPDAIVGRARQYGFTSDASHRFERGVDFELPGCAIERATELILSICGGEAGPVVGAESTTDLPRRPPLSVRVDRAVQVIGVPFSADEIVAILGRLGMPVETDGQLVTVTPPSYRFDLQIEEDLIEEIARIRGYESIPEKAPQGVLRMPALPERKRGAASMRRALAAREFQEVINYAFIEEAWERDFCGNHDPIRLANPIASQMSVMRSSLIGGLIGTLMVNQRRRTNRVRIFEIGRCFARDPSGYPVAGYNQPVKLAALAWGASEAEQWGVATRRVDFYDLKADIEALLDGRTLEFARADHPALHPGRAASVLCDGVSVGWIGELHPSWVQKYELGVAPIAFELDFEAVALRPMPVFAAPSKFPPMLRDIALVVPVGVNAGELLKVLQEAQAPITQAIELFDVYQGKGVDPDRKSVAFRIRFQHTDRTLEDAEVDAAINVLVGRAAERFGAQLRS
ncbi:phenylalanine--tRNA ligase subunit beta [Niveibacterium sp. 24ML]|uniref:phenylalanine--tRNA ligase subunit beta n=1 Tax=Niveibacterium sp. 24ML TaxID=2985512 RepID=UPI002270316F|nr:phenylalanine--tRNA ligase subunit beta [Niveibacterium sp. 24ML]MCX9156050.1 phenylalanine--tRNA ligase subunit beta [Niveibacterium sp. 24ML]